MYLYFQRDFFQLSVLGCRGEKNRKQMEEMREEEEMNWRNEKKSQWEQLLTQALPSTIEKGFLIFSEIYEKTCKEEEKKIIDNQNFVKIFVEDWWQRVGEILAKEQNQRKNRKDIQMENMENDKMSNLASNLQDSQSLVDQQNDIEDNTKKENSPPQIVKQLILPSKGKGK